MKTNTFRQLFEPMRTEVRSARAQAIYDQGRCRREGLINFATIPELLDLLSEGNRNDYLRKDLGTRGLLAEYQRGGARLWPTLLLVAYYPMLSRLRHRIWGDAMDDDDLDQLVITSFLSVCSCFDLERYDTYTVVRLRHATQRQVFNALRETQREREEHRKLEELAEDLGGLNPFQEYESAPSALELEEMAQALIGAC